MGSYSVDLCPIVNKGKAIKKKSSGSLPSVQGYEVPLVSVVCTPEVTEGWEVPLVPEGFDPCGMCGDVKVNSIKWYQRFRNQLNPIPPFEPIVIPEDYWVFECSIAQGFLEGSCPQCFPKNSKFLLVGNLGFTTHWAFAQKNRVKWTVARKNLPFPGEPIRVLTVVPGDGDSFRPRSPCAYAACGAPADSCHYPTWQIQTTGKYCTVAEGFFATPTWTSGKIANYYTDTLGWSDLDDDYLGYPDCSVYGDDSLKYAISVEQELKELTSVGFSAYITGSWVSLRKLGETYFEPYDDKVLGATGKLVILPWHINSVGG